MILLQSLPGPHPLLVVTKWGFIAYGSGKNATTTEFSDGKLNESTVKRVNLITDYFIKF